VSTSLRHLVWEESLPADVDHVLQEAVARVEPVSLRNILAAAIQGGKRVRPVLTALACAAAGGDEHDAVEAGAAVELLHVSSLVHDDIMDKGETRRGKPTVVHQHGTSVAILAGDALVALSFRMIQSIHHPRKDEIQHVLTSAFLSLCEGQCADVCNSTGTRGEPCTHTWMVERKTARLIEACTRIGALLASAPQSHVHALGAFGLSLGLAYQATDDLLDAIGNEQETGKSAGLDLQNGRTTYLSLAYPDRDRVEEIRAVVAAHTRDACAALDLLPPSPARTRMADLAQSLLQRTH
jgi:geranylgeranyl pyrophosphate synthase